MCVKWIALNRIWRELWTFEKIRHDIKTFKYSLIRVIYINQMIDINWNIMIR